MDKAKLIKLALLGAVIYLVSRSKAAPARSANVTVNPNVGEQGPQGPKGDKGDPGEQGPQGLQGLQGPAGVTTLSVVNRTSFGDSLLLNAAGEGNLNGWNGATGTLNNGVVEYSNNTTYVTNDTTFLADPNALYKIEMNLKNDSSVMLLALHPDATVTTNTLVATTSNIKRRVAKHFRVQKASKMQLAGTSGLPFTFDSVVVTKVPLGEPVPNNLPYLPVGQMVYDVTTNEVGRFNGTSVNYFAMQP